jgi:hypothetical protein
MEVLAGNGWVLPREWCRIQKSRRTFVVPTLLHLTKVRICWHSLQEYRLNNLYSREVLGAIKVLQARMKFDSKQKSPIQSGFQSILDSFERSRL